MLRRYALGTLHSLPRRMSPAKPASVIASPAPTLPGDNKLSRGVRRPTLLRKLSNASVASVGLSGSAAYLDLEDVTRPTRAARRKDSVSIATIDELEVQVDKVESRPPQTAKDVLAEYTAKDEAPPRSWVDWFAGTAAGAVHDRHEPEPPARTASPFSVLDPAAETFRALFLAAKEQGKHAEEVIEKELPPWARDRQDWKAPRLPLVFCHGLFGFRELGPENVPALRIQYWRGVKEALEKQGCRMITTEVPASASIEERAKVLADEIAKELPGEEINLIGHSMGGLDCRYLVSVLKPTTFKVRSVTTIATPHRGSPFADYLLDDVFGKQYLPKLLQLCDAVGLPGGGKAFDNLKTTSMARFNQQTPDADGIKYYSYNAKFEPGLLNAFRWPWRIIYDKEGDNDGLVSVQSSRWGEDLGTLEDVDHLHLVGWAFRLKYTMSTFTGAKIEYSPRNFYCSIADRLAEQGF